MHADSIGHVSFTWIFNHFYNQIMCILCMIYVFIIKRIATCIGTYTCTLARLLVMWWKRKY